MHNKVVTMAARAMRELGATTVRFNFRGTGDSEGAFDEGRGEVDDLHAVAAWVREQRPGDALWLAGFSFGAYVSLRAAASLRDRKSTRLNSSHECAARLPSSALKNK